MQILQYSGLHCCELTTGFQLRCNVNQGDEPHAADGHRSVTNANETCKPVGRRAPLMKGGSEHVRVPIMEVLLLPSGHR